MTTQSGIRGLAWAILLAATGSVLAEQPADETLDFIKQNNGKPPVSMTLAKDDFETVEGKFRQATVKIPAFQVKEVLYANRVQEYSTALDKREEGKFLAAIRFFRLALEKMNDRKWAAEYCNFGIAEGLYETENWINYKDAAGFEYKPAWHYYEEVINANPKSRFLLDCKIKLAIAKAKVGKFDDAAAAFTDAQNTIKKYRTDMGRLDSEYLKQGDRALAQYSLNFAQFLELKEDGKAEREQEYAEALNAFRKAQTAATGKFPDVYGDAVDGELRVMTKQKEFLAVKVRAQKLIDSIESGDASLNRILPGAYMAVGKAEFALALEYDGNRRLVMAQAAYAEARWNFLHVIVQFFDRDDYVARAHYLTAVCFEKRQDLEKDAIPRAISQYQMLVENYPRHELAAKAAEDLKRLGVVR